MILILSASSLQKRVKPGPSGINLLDLPRFTREEIGLYGLHLPTTMLAGQSAATVDRLRDQADKNACPCLLLEEIEAQPIAGDDDDAEAGLSRLERVIDVGHRIGCNAVAFRIAAKDNEQSFQDATDNTKRLLERADRFEMNLLLAPHSGLTAKPDRLTSLIKKIGGFRIGTLPDFHGAASGGASPAETVETLRKLTPYAAAVVGSTVAFDAKGRHEGYDLEACLGAIEAVGFDGALTVDYRGKGDPVEGIRKAKAVFDRFAAGPEEAEGDDGEVEIDADAEGEDLESRGRDE